MKKVLLIEDDAKIAGSIEFALTEEGYEVLLSESGELGLEIAHISKPDIILLDIMLPDKDGFEVCRALKSDNEFKSIPIVMLTALGDTENAVKGLTAGAGDYVAKPFSITELLARVKSHLRMKELYDVVKVEEEEKSALLDVSQSLSVSIDPHDTLYTIVVKIAEVIDVKRCSIIYVNTSTQKGYVMASQDSEEIKRMEIDLNKYPEIQKVMETGEQVVINDVLNDPILFSVRDVLNMIHIKSIMAFPITFKDSLIGTLVLRTSRREIPFNKREIRFCSVISHLAASPLKNAYLFEVLQKEKEQEREKRLAAEAMSKTSREMLEMIIEASPIPMCVFDKDGYVTDVNGSYLSEWASGVPRKKVIGNNLLNSFSDIRYQDFFKKILDIEKPKAELDTFSLKDKEKRTYIFQGTPIVDSEKGFIGGLFTTTDITQLKKTEEELRKAKDKAEKATKLKDKFVSLAAHDLKVPLAFMIGSFGFIKSNLPGTVEKDVGLIMEESLKTGNQMVRLIDDLLNLSRIKAGKIEPKYKFIDANFLVDKITANFKSLASQKGIKLKNKIQERTRIYADKTLISGVFQNLISNAIKFCRKGDSVSIFNPNGEPATFAVSDTGVGIKPERMENLFRFEEQTSTPGTIGEKGSGLGLPLNREIMGSHGGELIAESNPGEGSIFYAKFPYVNPKVLIVEDCKSSRTVLKKFLKTENVEITEAKNGKQALESIEESIPHLIISELELPIISGFELLQKLKSSQKTDSIPVIAINSCTNIETRYKVFRLGADDFVVKPLVFEELISRARKIIG